MASSAPAVMIGLDAAEITLVERWCAEGKLPTLAALRRNGEERFDPRIDCLVQRMPVAWNRLATISKLDEYITHRGGLGAPIDDSLEETRGGFGGPQDDRPATQNPCGDSPLQCLGCRCQRHPTRSDAWNEAVFRDRNERRIEDASLRCRGQLPGNQQPQVIGEGDLADEIAAQVQPANDDFLRIGG